MNTINYTSINVTRKLTKCNAPYIQMHFHNDKRHFIIMQKTVLGSLKFQSHKPRRGRRYCAKGKMNRERFRETCFPSARKRVYVCTSNFPQLLV